MTKFIGHRAHIVIRWAALFVALIVVSASLLQAANIKRVAADTGGYTWPDAPCATSGSNLGKTSGTGYWCTDYNWGESTCPSGDGYCTAANKMNGYYLYDQWGESFRNCVSYTAYKLSTVFNVNPSSWGNGADWNNSALAHGYTDDTSPQIGDIAQWDGTTQNQWGHVAYVYNVVGGVAYYDEYNYAADGNFLSSYTSASNSQGTPTHWIHIGTIPSNNPSSYDLNQFYVYGGAWNVYDVSTATNTKIVGAPFEDSSGGVWAQDANGHLRQFYYTNGTWVAFDVSNATGVNISGNPFVDTGGGVWARDTNNHLRQFYVANGSWTAFDVSSATGVSIAGDPAVDSGGGVWARDTNNHLRQFYVSGSWTAFDVTGATGVSIAGNPSVGAGGIFARDTNNQLRQFYVSNGAWTAANPSGATGVNVSGNPAQDSGGGVWIRDTNNHLRQFYVANGSWTAFDVSNATGVSITGDPSISSAGNFAEDTNNHLRQFYVSGSWTAADITGATGTSIHTSPASGSNGEFAGS